MNKFKTYRVWVVTEENPKSKNWVNITTNDHENIDFLLPEELYLEGVIDKRDNSYRIIDIQDITDDCFLED